MLYAIFESGGKQFKAVEGNYIEVDHLPVDVGKKLSFDKVLLLVNEKDVQVGMPLIKGASVDATVISHFKAKKILVFKYSPKKRYRVKNGHRQQYTRLIVDSIAFSGKAKTAGEPAVVEKEPAAEKTTGKPKAAPVKAASKPQKATSTATKKTAASKPAAKSTGSTKTTTKPKTAASKTTSAAKKTTSTATKKTAASKPADKTDKK
jgi:large subunit ribosomal protein L21